MLPLAEAVRSMAELTFAAGWMAAGMMAEAVCHHSALPLSVLAAHVSVQQLIVGLNSTDGYHLQGRGGKKTLGATAPGHHGLVIAC